MSGSPRSRDRPMNTVATAAPAKLIETEGEEGGMAIIEIGGMRLRAMDWDRVFSGNPQQQTQLVHIDG